MATPRTDAATLAPSTRAAAARARRESRRRPRSWLVFAVVGAVAALAVGAWFAADWWRATHTTLSFTRVDGPVPPLDLTFYPDQLAFAAPSPPPSLGEARLDGDSLTVDADLVPGRARVLYRGAGIGAGFAYVRLGEPLPEITLRAPQTLSGRVGEPLGYWCFGWRCDGYRPVADAEVVVMGGGEHGVELARAHTDADGRFEVSGFDGALDALGLRVRAPGFGIAHEPIGDLAAHAGERALVAVSRVPPRRGRLDLQVDVDPTSLLVLARGLPGVQATPAADGGFVLDHVPPSVEARIVVVGLPADTAQAPARTARGEEVVVPITAGAVVSGRVLGLELEPVAGALVWIGELPAVRTDAHGRYRIPGVPPGSAIVAAQWQAGRGRRAPTLRGARTVDLTPRGRHDHIDIPLDR